MVVILYGFLGQNLPLGEGGSKSRMRAAHRRCDQLRRKAELDIRFSLGIINAQWPSSVKNRLYESIFASFPWGKLFE